VTLEELWQAQELMRRAAADGELSADRLQRQLIKVRRANTPHELWKATGGRLGDKRRGDWPAWRGAVLRVVALVPLALAALWLLGWGLRQYYP
jgi:hypothetical protein